MWPHDWLYNGFYSRDEMFSLFCQTLHRRLSGNGVNVIIGASEGSEYVPIKQSKAARVSISPLKLSILKWLVGLAQKLWVHLSPK